MYPAVTARTCTLGTSKLQCSTCNTLKSPLRLAFSPFPTATDTAAPLAPTSPPPSPSSPCRPFTAISRPSRRSPLFVRAADNRPDLKDKADQTTRKFGLEAGLWEVFSSRDADGKSKSDQAKDLLKRYGSAYLLTSISFAIVSFAACYALVASGVDVSVILAKIGLKVTDTSEKVGTFAIAYAAHKALSPIRFPPTVALTPVVAKWLGKEVAVADGTTSSTDEYVDS